jgi:hypothetical protein
LRQDALLANLLSGLLRAQPGTPGKMKDFHSNRTC